MPSIASQTVARNLMSSPLVDRAEVKRVRFENGSRNQFGEYEQGDRSETDIMVVTVPLSGQEVLSLPEGLRSENVRRFYTESDVRAVKGGIAPQLSDHLMFDDAEWRVDIVRDWGGVREVICSEIRT